MYVADMGGVMRSTLKRTCRETRKKTLLQVPVRLEEARPFLRSDMVIPLELTFSSKLMNSTTCKQLVLNARVPVHTP